MIEMTEIPTSASAESARPMFSGEAPGCVPHDLKAPFPWFGGKRRAASLVWRHFGDVSNYVEPFAGSLAVLLCRPTKPGTETVNDADCYLSNFWRALAHDPEQVAFFADWPVNEADLLARHKWLIKQDEFRAQMKADPAFYDVKVAGWWVWGICSWIGQGWCHAESAQLPHLGDAGRDLAGYFEQLANRLRKVRVACGDWSRVLGESVTVKHGITGVFLDPPYSSDRNQSYAVDNANTAHDVRAWALANGDKPLLRIALCGYAGEHDLLGWHEVEWKAQGGYGSQANGQGRENSAKERIWFSPHCIISTVQQQCLF
jgi:hypothetical protein